MPCNSDPSDDDDLIPLAQPRTKTFNPAFIAVTGIEAQVCDDIARRQQMGIKKYGTQLADNPAGEIERLQHAYEECLDLAIYLKWQIETKTADMGKVKPLFVLSSHKPETLKLIDGEDFCVGSITFQPGETLTINKVTK